MVKMKVCQICSDAIIRDGIEMCPKCRYKQKILKNRERLQKRRKKNKKQSKLNSWEDVAKLFKTKVYYYTLSERKY